MQLRKRHKRNGLRTAKRCYYCGVRITVDNRSIDHVTPLSKKGSNAKENKVLACIPCNGRKAALSIDNFRELLERERRQPVVFFGERS